MKKVITLTAILLPLLVSCSVSTLPEPSPACEEWAYTVHEYRESLFGRTEITYEVSEEDFWQILPNKRYIKRKDCTLHLYIDAQDPLKGSGSACEEWAYVLYYYEYVSTTKSIMRESKVGQEKFWKITNDGYFSRDGCTLRLPTEFGHDIRIKYSLTTPAT